MESKNVKVIDEHSIDRNAKIICGFSINGEKYVLYSIERDSDNDNLFVSKIVGNLDGTYNMANIDDSMIKGKIDAIVKELIKYSVDNEADKLDSTSVKLSSGSVEIIDVSFNKEQNINVTKTYVATVKKAVTKVGEDFYKVKNPIVSELSEMPRGDVELPTTVDAPVELATPSIDNVTIPLEEAQKEETLEPENVPTVEPVLPEEPSLAPLTEQVTNPELINALDQAVDDLKIDDVPNGSEKKLDNELEMVDAPKEESINGSVLNNNESKSEKAFFGNAAPVLPVTPVEVPSEKVPMSFESAPLMTPPELAKEESSLIQSAIPSPGDVPSDNKLIFDGSKETNLKFVFDDNSANNVSKAISSNDENVESLREFGVDQPIINTDELKAPQESVNGPVLKKSKGFANNKFFMVVAIVIFIAACVFLGYEAFQYFKIVG